VRGTSRSKVTDAHRQRLRRAVRFRCRRRPTTKFTRPRLEVRIQSPSGESANQRFRCRDCIEPIAVERIRREAASIGLATAALCELILERRPHLEQGFPACLGIVRLVRPFGPNRLEAAATRAIEIGTPTRGTRRAGKAYADRG